MNGLTPLALIALLLEAFGLGVVATVWLEFWVERRLDRKAHPPVKDEQ